MSLPQPAPPATRPTPAAIRSLLRFHSPLAMQAVLLTLSGPLLGGIVARSASPERELASFWLAFTVALFAQSLCLALQQSTIAAVRADVPLQSVLRSALIIGSSASLALALLADQRIGLRFFSQVIPTLPATAAHACELLRILTPIPLLISLRSVAQGIAVGRRRTALVATHTAARVLVLFLGLATAMTFAPIGGARVGAWLILAGISLETAGMIWATASVWLREWTSASSTSQSLNRSWNWRFTAPLAVAALGWTATRPMLHAVLGRLEDPERAQAAFGLLLPWLLVCGAPLWALLETTLVMAQDRARERAVHHFAMLLAAVTSATIAVLILPAVRPLWLDHALGGAHGLRPWIEPGLPLLVLTPWLIAIRAVAQGRLMREGRARVLFVLAPIRLLGVIAAAGAALYFHPPVHGSVLALGLVLCGDGIDAIGYAWAALRPVRPALRTRSHTEEPAPISVEDTDRLRRAA